MRPIVSFCGSPTYQLSKYLTTILQPLTDKSRRTLQSTENFIDAIKTVQIPDNYKLVSCVFNWLYRVQRPQSNNLPLNLCLTSTYFQYNGKHYKQLHGTAMGLPISVVAETVMQHTEKRPCNLPTNNIALVTLR